MSSRAGVAPRTEPRSAALRLGLAGFGRLARTYYVPALRALRGVEVVAAADPLPASRAAAAAALAGVEPFADTAAMLAATPLDGLLVATPPSTHLRIWNDAAARGLAVFMEKPFVLAGELERVVPGSGPARLMMDFNRRFWPPYRRAGRLVRDGAIGRPVTIDYRLHVDVAAWCTVTSHRLAAAEGGVLHDLGSQALDLVVELVGEEPTVVDAETSTRRWAHDHVRLRLEFASGTAALCDLAYGARTRERLVVRGPAGTIELPDPNMALHLVRGRGATSGLGARCADVAVLGYRALRPARAMARFTIARALERFVGALPAGLPLSPGLADATRNVRWLETAARAARTPA